MRLGFKAALASAIGLALAGGGSLAQAQPEYPEGYLPPPPYAYQQGNRDEGYRDEGYYAAGSCGGGSFTLLGANAGVTVLGVDLGAGAHLGVPTGGGCGEQGGGRFVARPHAPPPADFGDEGPPGYGYGPPPPPMGQGYGDPCGCMPARW